MASREEQLDTIQKHEYVHRWLEEVFGEAVPQYEVNGGTVDWLLHLAQENRRREREAKVVMENFQQMTKECGAEAARLRSVMDWMGFKLDGLSPSTQSYVKIIADIATTLGLKDCSDTSFCLALTDLSQELAVKAVQMQEASAQLKKLQEDTKSLLLRDSSHRRVLGSLTEEVRAEVPAVAKRKRDTEFLRQKTEQYQKLADTMKEELISSGYEPSLSHGALIQFAKEVEEVQSQLAPLKTQLTSYQDLPPDLDLAKVKVEEMRRELAKLEAELSRTIDLVHAEK